MTRLIVLNNFLLSFFLYDIARVWVRMCVFHQWSYIGSVRAHSTYTFFLSSILIRSIGVCVCVLRCSRFISCIFRLVHLLGRLFLWLLCFNFFQQHSNKIFRFHAVIWSLTPNWKEYCEWMMPSEQVNKHDDKNICIDVTNFMLHEIRSSDRVGSSQIKPTFVSTTNNCGCLWCAAENFHRMRFFECVIYDFWLTEWKRDNCFRAYASGWSKV